MLAELSYFFRQLCAKELEYEVVAKLEEHAPELLCKLEMIFPPGFFYPMQHMILHLAYEVEWEDLCSSDSSMHLNGSSSIFVGNVRIKPALKPP